ncbi:RHS repeat-associated core domain-containing protein [Pseudomonas umsongensis]|jgi:RHS repeat-associated protein|uniref:RHS repeat-associated core domain-containing protein n=1 Tax=Pseudomonas umsongensis TaxID=198618 RepID=UPI0015BA2EFA|nr:RHS repeat-associated core domain-containing protein [Pseudomonas umsongensis]NWL20075.1 hypothetical protein [Pseudomonas umsongensis]
MLSQNKEVLCTYHYDALDRLIGLNSVTQDTLQRFYCKSRLATEIQGLVHCSIVQQGDLLLAQHKRLGDALETALLATDQQRSVKHTVGERPLPIVYSPYGHRRAESGLTSLLGFNGERPDVITGHYLLGNGHRAFNPVLMRFNSPDSLSPFGKGGLNAYSYCSGDPVNRSDPSGRKWFSKTTKALHGLWLSYTKNSLGFIDLAAAMIPAKTNLKRVINQIPGAKGMDGTWSPKLSKEMSERAEASALKSMSSNIDAGTLAEPGLAYIRDHSKKNIFVMDDLRSISADGVITAWERDSVLSPVFTKQASQHSSIKAYRKFLENKLALAETELVKVESKLIRLTAENKLL